MIDTIRKMPLGVKLFLIAFAIIWFTWVFAFPPTDNGDFERWTFLSALLSSYIFWGVVVAIAVIILIWPTKRQH